MLVREKRTGEEWSFPLELELVPPIPMPKTATACRIEADAGKPMSYRNVIGGVGVRAGGR